MLLQFAAPKQKKDLRDVFMRFIKKHHPDAKGCALVCNTAYNMDWYNDHLRKEEDVQNVATDDFNVELFESTLPDKDTQDALQVAQRRRPVGAYWIHHEAYVVANVERRTPAGVPNCVRRTVRTSAAPSIA